MYIHVHVVHACYGCRTIHTWVKKTFSIFIQLIGETRVSASSRRVTLVTVMNEERTGKYLRQVEHIRGNL
jgi:hypothetical protein